MGTEDWVFKGAKLITNTKKQRLKIYSRGWIFKNTILMKKRQSHKNLGLSFCKVIVGYKNEN